MVPRPPRRGRHVVPATEPPCPPGVFTVTVLSQASALVPALSSRVSWTPGVSPALGHVAGASPWLSFGARCLLLVPHMAWCLGVLAVTSLPSFSRSLSQLPRLGPVDPRGSHGRTPSGPQHFVLGLERRCSVQGKRNWLNVPCSLSHRVLLSPQDRAAVGS